MRASATTRRSFNYFGVIALMSDSFYRHHVFFCTNVRADGSKACGDCGAADIRGYAKDRIKQLGLSGKGKVRINSAGCLDRCNDGPVLVVYPEGVWYTYVDQEDIEEIVVSHLQNGKIVERLLLAGE